MSIVPLMSDPTAAGNQGLGIFGKIFLSLFLSAFLVAGIFFAWSMFKDGFPGWAEVVFLVFFLLFFMGIPGLMLVVVWLAKPTTGQPEPVAPNRSITEAACPGEKVTWFASAFGSLFALCGIAVAAFVSVPIWLELAELPRYVPTPATVISSEVKTHSGDSTTYSVLIRYRYRVGGETYESDRFGLISISSSGYADKDRTVKAYPPSKEFTCYVSPTRPERAVIHNEWDWSYLLTCIPLIFIVVGFSIILLRNKVAGPRPNAVSLIEPAAATGVPVSLKPGQTPKGQFITALIVAIFWNGITSIFVWQILDGFKKDNPDWVLVLFMIPFVLIGLALIGGVIYTGAALFNPKFDLRVTGPTALGLPLRLDWRCLGSTGRIAGLRMTLLGQEIQIYTSGSGKNQSTRTERSTFYRQHLVESTDRHHFAAGALEVTLPAENAVPTLSGRVCQIAWTLEFRARIRNWPDISLDYPLTVAPFPSGARR